MSVKKIAQAIVSANKIADTNKRTDITKALYKVFQQKQDVGISMMCDICPVLNEQLSGEQVTNEIFLIMSMAVDEVLQAFYFEERTAFYASPKFNSDELGTVYVEDIIYKKHDICKIL